MHRLTSLLESLSGASYGGVGLLVAAAMLLSLRLLLPAERRRELRLPGGLLLGHLALIGLRATLPPGVPVMRPLGTIALFLLLASMARAAFLLAFVAVRGSRRSIPKIFHDIVQGVLYAAAAILSLEAAGVEPGSLLTTSALLTAVIGLSLQETLGNLFAGLAIQVQVPFELGDWISVDGSSKLIGKVIEINWRATKILTNDDVEIIIPNGALAKANIFNYTKPTAVSRRTVEFSCAYDVPPGRVREVVLGALGGVRDVVAEPGPSVLLGQFADSGVQYVLYFFTDNFGRRNPIESEVRERVWYALHRAGLEFPFPVRDVRMQQVQAPSPEHQRAEAHRHRVEALRGVDLLAVLPDDALERLADLIEHRLYAGDELILRQGDAGQELFIIEEGQVRVLVGEKEAVEVARLGAGQFFGEMSLMTGAQRSATVQAVSPCELLVVGKAAFQRVLCDHTDVIDKISEALAARQEKLSRRASELPAADDGPAAIPREQLLGRIRSFFSL